MRTVSWLLAAAAGFVLLPALHAQAFPGANGRPAAKVIVETGQVSVLKDGYPYVLNQGDLIQVTQTVVTGPDGYAKFQLPDNTTIEVFQNSKFIFHDNYPSLLDMLYVFIGRVKIFEEHSRGENSKRVTTPTAVISVRGTTYDVVVEDDDGTTFVTVDEGAVQVGNRTAPGVDVLLNAGQSIRVFRGQPLQPQQVDHAAAYRAVLRAAREAVNQILIGRSPSGLPGGIGTKTGQGDHGSPNGGGTGTGTTNGAPAPPSGPPGSGH
jgi:hypothetical protein